MNTEKEPSIFLKGSDYREFVNFAINSNKKWRFAENNGQLQIYDRDEWGLLIKSNYEFDSWYSKNLGYQKLIEQFYKIMNIENDKEVLTIRDQFAIAAISGFLSSPLSGEEYFKYPNWPDGIANDCYKIADAMMEARRK